MEVDSSCSDLSFWKWRRLCRAKRGMDHTELHCYWVRWKKYVMANSFVSFIEKDDSYQYSYHRCGHFFQLSTTKLLCVMRDIPSIKYRYIFVGVSYCEWRSHTIFLAVCSHVTAAHFHIDRPSSVTTLLRGIVQSRCCLSCTSCTTLIRLEDTEESRTHFSPKLRCLMK